MIEKKLLTFENCLITLVVFSFLLAPPLYIKPFHFAFQITDILFPFVIVVILKNKWYKNISIKELIILASVPLYVFGGILINGQIRVLNGYFEIYKIIKLVIFFIFFREQTSIKLIKSILDIAFLFLFVFNFLHYFNIFNFNEIVMPLYCGTENLNLIFFGYDSIGEPATKRMLGTLGNPNNNALVFLLFMILYAPHRDWKRKEIILFFLALTAFVLCQSRTGIIAFVCMIIVNYFFSAIHWKKILVQSICIILVVFLLTNNFYILSYFNINLRGDSSLYLKTLFTGDAFKSNSVNERFKVWSILAEKIKEKPIFGHSPDKNFFYDNKIYADNEYLALLYKYGIIGFIAYLLVYLLPSFRAFKLARNSLDAKNIILISVVAMVTAMTNFVFLHTQISIFYILILGISFHSIKKERLNMLNLIFHAN